MAEKKSEIFRSNAPQEIAMMEVTDLKRKAHAEATDAKLRQIVDRNDTGTEGGHEHANVRIKKHAANAPLDPSIAKHADNTDPVAAIPVAEPPPMPVLIKKDDAIPWALAAHLEVRFKNLSSKTAVVNQELDLLETASQKLAKRIEK